MIPETIPGIRLVQPCKKNLRAGALPAQMIFRSRLMPPCIKDLLAGALPAAP